LSALAGCLTTSGNLPETPLAVSPAFSGYSWPAPVAYSGDGAAASALSGTPTGVERMIPDQGGEPNIGITAQGSIVITALNEVFRSQDKGATWQKVEELLSPGAPNLSENYFSTSDPNLWVDPITNRIFVDQMHPGLECTYLAFSDKEGDNGSWVNRPLDCGTAYPYLDHQKIMTAPHGPSAPTGVLGMVPAVYPDVTYLCVNKIEFGTFCASSLDGGLTFSKDVQVSPYDPNCDAINGHPAAYPDGTVVVPLTSMGLTCKRPLEVAITQDDGATWTVRACNPKLSEQEIDASIVVTKDGTAYELFRDKDQVEHLLRTKDKFQTCQSWRVAPPNQTMDVFAAATAGDDGRIALAYLGTNLSQPPDTTVSDALLGTKWQLYVSTSFDAESSTPTFTTVQVTPNEDPVQIGCVWEEGGGGGEHSCRNLLDFIDMKHDSDGRWYVVFTDGCTPRNGCTGNPDVASLQTRDREDGVAVETSGASLFAAKGTLAPLEYTPPAPLAR
jgi:hypothetical protein